MMDCKECPADEKKKLLDELMASKKKKAKRVKDKEISESEDISTSTLFSTIFGGKVLETVCADIGADENLLDSNLMKTFSDKNIIKKFQILSQPIIFDMNALAEDGTSEKLHAISKYPFTWNYISAMARH